MWPHPKRAKAAQVALAYWPRNSRLVPILGTTKPARLDDNSLEPSRSSLPPKVCDAGFDPVDAGPLRIARYTEPFALLMGQLAYEGPNGPGGAYRFERFK